jgi:aspartyl-tRNA(Asn)/glutamyl-tRNA(Gln) amidotransferase subunit C
MAERITESEVLHAAQLSRLKLTPQEVHHFTEQLSHVLEYINKLSEVDITDVEPMAHPLDVTNVMREDVPEPGMAVDAALSNAPQQAPPFFRVPKVLGDASGA